MSRSYGGRTADDRLADRRARLVEAGLEIVGTGGVAALGMRAVCRQANLSQKFFYESFADIDDLLHAVYGEALARLQSALAPAMESGSLEGCVGAAAELLENDPRICRVLLVEPVADERLRVYVRDTSPALALSILGDRVPGSPDDPAVRMRFSAVFGAIISLFVEWTEGSLGDDRGVFARHVTAVVTTLLEL